MPINLFLTGLRGTGKSTIGKILSEKLNLPFLDLDTEIEKKADQKISTIVETRGWDYFRDLEHKTVKEISKLKNHIIALGGGTIIFERNLKLLKKKNNLIILLVSDLKKIAKRIENCKNRPSLSGKKNFLNELEDIWNERKEKYYAAADLVIKDKNLTPDQIANQIIYQMICNTKKKQ